MADVLFVYGTMMPGHLRWPLLAPHAVAWRDATTPGALWDTGRGWPAATFEGCATDGLSVPGRAIELSPDGIGELLTELDVAEGVPHGLFRRSRIALHDATTAWAYETLLPVDRFTRIAAWTDQPER